MNLLTENVPSIKAHIFGGLYKDGWRQRVIDFALFARKSRNSARDVISNA